MHSPYGMTNYRERLGDEHGDYFHLQSHREVLSEKSPQHSHVPPLPEDKREQLRNLVIKREKLLERYNRLHRIANRMRQMAFKCYSEATELASECRKIETFDGHYRNDTDFQIWGDPGDRAPMPSMFIYPAWIKESQSKEANRTHRHFRNKEN